MYTPYNNNIPYGYQPQPQPQPQPPNTYRNQNFINPPPGKYIPPVNPNYNNNIQPGGNQYQNNGGIYNNNYNNNNNNNNPPAFNQFPNNPINYGNNGYNNYGNQQGGNLYQGNGNFYGNNNNYNNPSQQYPGQNNASFSQNTNNSGEVEFGFSSSIYGTQTDQPKSNGANNIYGSNNNTNQNPPQIYQAQQQKNIPGYNQPQKYQNNQFPPNGQINGNTQQNQKIFNNPNQNSSQNNVIYPGQQMPSPQNFNIIQQPGNNNAYNFNNTNNIQPNFTNNMIQQQKPKIENVLIPNQQNLNIQQNNPQIPQGNNFNNNFQGISPQAPFNPNQQKINYNNNIQTNQIINQQQNILNNNILNKQGPELNKINNQFSGMNISGQNNNFNNLNNNNFNNNPNNFSNNYNNNNILNNNNLNNINNFNNNNSSNMNNNIINNNNFSNNNNNFDINANPDPSKLLNNNGPNKNQNNFKSLNDKMDKIFDTKTVVETQISNADNFNKINQDVIKKQGQYSSPYPNAIEFSNNDKQKRENNNFEDKPGNQPNIINLFNLPETSTIKQESISKPNIQQNNNNQKEWKDVVLDPLAQVCVVQTKIVDKNNNNNKENESNVDDEEKASKSINPFYQENPFENNLEGSNNQWRVPDNNDFKPKENEVKKPVQNTNPQFNLNFSSIKEVNTIINEKPKEQNDIDNLNTEKNKKEWGNINLDPLADANIVATKVENKNTEQDKKEGGNINLDPFDEAKVVETKVENKNRDNENKEEMDEESRAASTLNPFCSDRSNPYANILEESNNLNSIQNNSIKSNENKVEQPNKDINFEDIPNPFTNLVESNTIISENNKGNSNIIDTKDDKKINDFDNVDLDPLGKAKLAETVLEEKKEDIKEKNSDEDNDDDFNTASVVLQFSRGNDIQFETKVQDNNNKENSQNNNISNNQKDEKPVKDNFNLVNNLNFSCIPESNTIISEKPGQSNNIDNLNTEQNKKEWGNINLDPFADANIVATKVENKNIGQDKKEWGNINLDPFADANIVATKVENKNIEQNKNEWGNINLDPFAEANIVATKVENKKQDNENKEEMDEESRAASTLNPFSSDRSNPYANNLEGSNNFDNIQNNSIKSSEYKVDQPNIDTNLEDIPDPLINLNESNTVLFENKKGDSNNIDEKNDNIKKEWGNIDIDPFGKANLAQTVLEEKKEDIKETKNDEDDDDDFNTASVVYQFSGGNENQFEAKNEEKNNLENSENKDNNNIYNNKKDEQPGNANINLGNNLNSDSNIIIDNSIKTEPKKEEIKNIEEKKEGNFDENEIEDKKDMENNLIKISIPNPFYYDNPDNAENKNEENNNLQNDENNDNSNQNENQINQSQNNSNCNLNLLSNIISGNQNDNQDESNHLNGEINEGINNFSGNMPNNQIQDNNNNNPNIDIPQENSSNNENQNQNPETITVPSLSQIITGELEMKK